MSTTFKANVQDATINNALTVDTNTLYVDPVNNGVCVGTTTLTSGNKLTVNGKADFADVVGLPKIATGSLPAAASYEGYIVYDDTLNKFVYSNGSSWVDPSGGGSMSIGGTVTSGTTGSILFVGSGPVLAQDNSNFFWDDTNNRLGIGTATPSTALHVAGAGTITGNLTVDTNTLYVDATNNRVGVGNASPTVPLDVTGATNISGQLTLSGGLVLGTEVSSLVPASHLMQINATGAIAPLMISGGSGSIQYWKDTAGSKATAFGMAKPGDAVGDDFVLATYATGGSWTTRLTVANATGLATFANSVAITSNLTVDTDVFYVDATNNRVGVGNASPSYTFDLKRSVASAVMGRIQNDSSTGYSGFIFNDHSSTYQGFVGWGNTGSASPAMAGKFGLNTAVGDLVFAAADSQKIAMNQAGQLSFTPTAVTTAANGYISNLSLGGSFTKNDGNAYTFHVQQIKPTFNFGGSNSGTTVNILNIDSTNTSTTGNTANLLKASYGGTERFRIGSAGDIYFNSSAGTSGQVLKSAGTGSPPTWSAAVAMGDAITSGTTGSVLFIGSSAALSQDNANFFWDDTNNRLGIGTSSPSTAIHTTGVVTAGGGITSGGNITLSGDYDILPNADNTGEIGTDALRWNRVRANTVVTGSSLIFDNNIRPKDSNYTFEIRKADNSTVVAAFDTANGRFGIGTNTPSAALDVAGSIKVSGSIAVPNVALSTTADVYLSVTSGGSDSFNASRSPIQGGDYTSYPYATIAAAIADCPKVLKHNIFISVGAGTFTGCAISGFIGGGIDADGYPVGIYITGTSAQTSPATGVASGTAGSGTSTTSIVKPTAAANWTASDSNVKGKFAKITGGAGYISADRPIYRPIKANTTTNLSVDAIPDIDNTTTFEIIDCNTTISKISGSDLVGFRITNNTAPIMIRMIKVADASTLDYNLHSIGNNIVAFDGVRVQTATTFRNVLSSKDGDVTFSNSIFTTAANFKAEYVGKFVKLENCWVDAAGPITIQDALNGKITKLDSVDAPSYVLEAINMNSLQAEVKADSGDATPVYLKDISSFEAIGSNKLTGSGNTGTGCYGVQTEGSGKYNFAGSDITGDDGDVKFFGNVVSWSGILNHASYGIVDSYAGNAVGSGAAQKSVTYGARTFIDEAKFSSRLQTYGFLNQSSNLSVITLGANEEYHMDGYIYSPTSPATGVQSGAAGTGTTTTSLVKPNAAADWTASNLVGKWVRITDGGGTGYIRQITANTTTALTLSAAITGLTSGSTFEILDKTTEETVLGVLEVLCNDASAKVFLPSGAAIAGVQITIINRGSSTCPIYGETNGTTGDAFVQGTINGGGSTSITSNAAKVFCSLTGNSGKDYWIISS